MTGFEAVWRRFHPGFDPVGYLMREAGAPNWVRFHSLPGSKRYAETDAERAIILDRQNALAMEVLGAGPCWLVRSEPFDLDLANAFASGEGRFDEEPEVAQAEGPWQGEAVPTRWAPGAFDDLLLAIADDRAGRTLWISEADGAVFAPYDGGVDLFLPEPGRVLAVKAAHPDWLSPHPGGL